MLDRFVRWLSRSGRQQSIPAAAQAAKPVAPARKAAPLHVPQRDTEPLILRNRRDLLELPPDLDRPVIDVSQCENLAALPAGWRVGRLIARDCPRLEKLSAVLDCYALDLTNSSIERLPADLRVRMRLDLTGCTRLRELPPALSVGVLVLRGCTALRELPERLTTTFLDLSGCTALERLPANLAVAAGRLELRDCAALRSLPAGLGPLAQLDLAGCVGISELPESLVVTSWLDLAQTAITTLPPGVEHAQLRWRGVPIDSRIAFRPAEITAAEVLAERNAERRRVMVERMGFERFLAEAGAELIDTDRDPGGPRRLLRVQLAGDEDLVCLSVHCPSTGRHYLLRVPPATTSCHVAAAWVAGYDDPSQYRPLLET